MKKRVLLIGDSARVNTGYGVVLRNIGNSIVNSGIAEVRQIGIFDAVAKRNPSVEEVKFKVYDTRYSAVTPQDRMGEKTFDDILKEYCPHIVITVGDPWHLYYVGSTKVKDKFKWISYVPVDGTPYPRVMPYRGKWLRLTDITSKPDYVIAFNKFGSEVLVNAGVDVHKIINHGVDIDLYRPLSDKISFRKEFFKEYDGIEDALLFGFVGRNQFRKNLPSVLKAWKIFLDNKPNKKCYLYFHTPNDDAFKGFNLPEIIKTLDVPSDTIILPENLNSGLGISTNDMNKMYNAFDCLISGTMGEGWGLPFLEAMSAGTPTILPNYSGHLEFAEGTSWLIDIKDYIVEIVSGIDRAIIDEKHLSELMHKFINLSEEEKHILSDIHVKNAAKFQWSEVNKNWVDLISEIEVSDYSFNKKDFLLREQDQIFIEDDGRYKVVGSPIDLHVSPNKAPKIGIVSTYNEKCGIATYTKNLKNAIKRVSGEENCVVFSELKDYNILFKQIVSSNVDVVHWQHEPGIIKYDNTMMRFLLDMKKVKPELKHIFTLHAEHPVIKSNLDGLADAVILHANKGGYDFNYSKDVHIDHPIPTYTVSSDIRKSIRQELGVSDKTVIGFNGFMTPSKGLDTILKGMGKLLKGSDEFILYFLNSMPENPIAKQNAERLLGSITDIIKEMGLEDKVIIDTTFYSKEEMSKRIQAFDLGIAFMGGDTLSQSGSIAEMIANHVPVMASNVGHFQHMIKSGFCFPIEDHGNVYLFAQNLVDFVTSKFFSTSVFKVREKISKDVGKLSYDVFAQKHLDLYKSLVNDNGNNK